jgi:hypothetical protein
MKRWTARIITALVVLFLLFDAVIHMTQEPHVVAAFTHVGYPMSVAVALGVTEFVCIVLYLIPRTAFLGAILLTAYLGGATATHVRVGDPFAFPIAFGVLVWVGLILRDDRLRTFIAWKG